MLFVALFLQFEHSVITFVMAYARLAIVFYMLPALGERVMSNLIIKNTIVALTIIGLWPCFDQVIIPEQGWFILLIKEFIVGLMLSMSLCVPFWIIIGLGEILDNQRGATISDSIDPVNGVQSSLLSGFLNFAFGAIFFLSGGMRTLLEAMVASYQFIPRGGDLLALHGEKAGDLIMAIVQGGVILAGPVLIIMMVAEILLGVFARYCPQLNPFSLSLTIKSFIAFSIFMIYGFQAMAGKPLHMFSSTTFQHFFS